MESGSSGPPVALRGLEQHVKLTNQYQHPGLKHIGNHCIAIRLPNVTDSPNVVFDLKRPQSLIAGPIDFPIKSRNSLHSN
jgi:hypothetical protein